MYTPHNSLAEQVELQGHEAQQHRPPSNFLRPDPDEIDDDKEWKLRLGREKNAAYRERYPERVKESRQKWEASADKERRRQQWRDSKRRAAKRALAAAGGGKGAP